MNLIEYDKYKDKLQRMECLRLKKLGYSDIDAHTLSKESIDTKITNILLLQLVTEVKKK